MTPLAQRLLRNWIRSGPRDMALMLAKATCFDMTPVAPLINRTGAELIGTTTDKTSEAPLMEHGGLLFTPSEVAWLEAAGSPSGFIQTEHRFGVLVNSVEDQLGCFAFDVDGRMVAMGFIEMKPDGEHFSVHHDVRSPEQSPRAAQMSANACGWAAASLLLINAPHGVERATTPPHRGLERDVRRALGIGGLRPAHTIRLSVMPGEIGDGTGRPGGSPKAFHFCRSHIRRLPSGATTRVRAHWRGDPSLGVTQGDYRVTQ